MNPPPRRIPRRPNMRRAVILFPSGFTLGNLFFGIFAIIAASRLQFTAASVYVLLGGICDALDGRVARATNAGTQFGEELDSLVDAITFGLAPGMIMYFAVLNREGWDWLLVFIFSACAVMRLARFNIEQAGTAKTYFRGLPSPAAGITLASYYWFSQSWLYNYGAVADLPWHVLLRFVMGGLAGLMISPVPYPTFPRTGFHSLRSLGASLLVIGSVVLLATRRLEYFFPIALVYVFWGLFRWVFAGLFERRQPTVPYDLSEGEDDEDEEEEFDQSDAEVHPPRARAEPRHARVERGRGGRVERVEPVERVERDKAAERPRRDDAPRREKRRERPKRGERPPLGEHPEAVTGVPSIPPVATIPPKPLVSTDDEGDDESLAPEDSFEGESSATAPTGEGAPPRKRKRRRRRGERKERGEVILGTVEGGAAPTDGAPDSAYRESEGERASVAEPPAPPASPPPSPAQPSPSTSPPASEPTE